MTAGNILDKCPECGAVVNTTWQHCIVCNALLSPPVDVLLAEAVKGTRLTPDEFRAQLPDFDIEGIESGEVDIECLRVGAKSMAMWLKPTK